MFLGNVASLLALCHALIFEVLVICFGRSETAGEFVVWVATSTLLLPVIWHAGVTWWTTVEGRGHDPLPDGKWAGEIDVFVTVCGEPLSLVLRIIRAARDMDIPHNTWVLDDGGSDELRDTCTTEGIGYLRRPAREHGKAGNINYGLRRTGGDLVAVFDADQEPAREFLAATVDHFSDEAVAFVQTPQKYVCRNEFVASGARQAQYIFYRYILPGQARRGAAVCVGTNVVFRRAALEHAGGFHEGSQSEDVHTSLLLHSLGWRSVYVRRLLAQGLPPQDWSAHFRQQRRWARGGFEILISTRLWKRSRLAPAQRLHYVALGMHYLTSIVFLLMTIFPGCYLITRTSPMDIHPAVPVGITSGAILAVALVNRIQNSSYAIAGAIAQVVAAPAHLLGLFDALRGRDVDWVPTHGLPPSRRAATADAPVRGMVVVVALAAVIVGIAAALARAGFAGAAALLGMPSADDLWIALPIAWCLVTAAIFLLPSIHHLRIARTPRAIRWGAVLLCAVLAMLAEAVITPLSASPGPASQRPTTAWVWRDDFSGSGDSQPSQQDWKFVTGHNYPGGPANWGTGELQEYVRSSSNLRLDGRGNLEIRATAADGDYRSARIETQRNDFIPPRNGTLRLEAKVNLPAARGIWATFWALGRSYRKDLRWPISGEIDAIEYRGSRPDEVYGVLHCPDCGEPEGKRSLYRDPAGLSDGFHTYTLDWRNGPDRLDWYVDGHRYQSITRQELGEHSWVFDQPMFLLLNVAVGGDWPGRPNESDYPASMFVDYVEVQACLGQCVSPARS